MDGIDMRDRIRGSLLWGAVGDALGAPVEFMSLVAIREMCGPAGVTDFLPAYGRVGGAITDDTQMTLFTAEGLIPAIVRQGAHRMVDAMSDVHRAYLRWLSTQAGHRASSTSPDRSGWLVNVAALHSLRAPGNTCLASLESGRAGSLEEPINNSKGCGGVMRAAPAGLIDHPDPFRLGAQCAALTHGHPSGYLAAGFLALLIRDLRTGATLDDSLDHATEVLRTFDGHEETLAAINGARQLASDGRPSAEDIETLGAAWVGEEALAIAVCCVLAHSDNPRDAVLLAVNHSGDSDSTGSMAGNIVGAIHGVTGVDTFIDRLELADVITQVADDLYAALNPGADGGDNQPPTPAVDDLARRYPGS